MPKVSAEGQTALEGKCHGLIESLKTATGELSRGSNMKSKYLKVIKDVEGFLKCSRVEKSDTTKSKEDGTSQNEKYLLTSESTSFDDVGKDAKFPFDVCTVTILEGVEGCKSKGKALLPLISAIQHLLCISDLLVKEDDAYSMLKDLFKAFELISSSSVEPVLLRLVQTILQLCSQNSHILSFSDMIIRAFQIFDSLLQSKVDSVVKCGLRQLVSCIAVQNVVGCIIAPNKLRNEDIILQIVTTMCNILRNIHTHVPQKPKLGYGLFKRDTSQGKLSRNNTEESTRNEVQEGDKSPDATKHGSEEKDEGALFGNVSTFALYNLDGKLAFDMLSILVDSLPSGVFVTSGSLQNSLNSNILPCINHLFVENPRDASILLTKILIRHIYYAESHKSCEIGVQLSLSQFEEFIHKGVKALSNDQVSKETSKAWINCFKQLLGSPEFIYASMCSNLIHRELLGAISKFKERDVEDSQHRANLTTNAGKNDSSMIEPWNIESTCQISHLLRPLPLFSIEVNADTCALDVNNVHKDFSIENIYLQCVYNYVSTLYTITLNCARDTVYYVPYKILYMDGSGIKCSTNMNFRLDVEALIGVIKGFKKYDRAVFTCLQGLLVVCKLKELDNAYKECLDLIIGKHVIKSSDAEYDIFTLNSTMCMCSLIINFSGVLTQEAWFLVLVKLFGILYEHDPEVDEVHTLEKKLTDSPRSPLADKRRTSDPNNLQKDDESVRTSRSLQYFMRKFVPIIWSILKSKIEACDSESVSKFLIASGFFLTYEIYGGMHTPVLCEDSEAVQGYSSLINSISHFVKEWEMLYVEMSRKSEHYSGTEFEKGLKALFRENVPWKSFEGSPEAGTRYHNFLVKVYITCTESVPFTSYKIVTMLNSMILYTCSSENTMQGLETITSYIAKRTCSLITQVCISNRHSTNSIEAPLCLLYQLSLECKRAFTSSAEENFVSVTLEHLLSGLYSVARSVFNILEKGDCTLDILYMLTEICTQSGTEQTLETSKHSCNVDVIIDIFVSLVENSLDYLNEKMNGEKFAKCLHMLVNGTFSDNVIFRVIGLMVDFADHLMKKCSVDNVVKNTVENAVENAVDKMDKNGMENNHYTLLCTILSIFKSACLSSNTSRKNCAIKSLALFIQTHLHSFERRLWEYTCKDVLLSVSEGLRENVDVEVRKYVASNGTEISVNGTISALSETQSLLLVCKEFAMSMVGSNMLYCAVDVLTSLLRGMGSSINAILTIKSTIIDLKSAFSTLSTILVEYKGIKGVWNAGLHLLDELQGEETMQGIFLVLCAVLTDPNVEIGQTEDIVKVCIGKDVPLPRKPSLEMLSFVIPPWLHSGGDEYKSLGLSENVRHYNEVAVTSSMASVLKIELRDKIANSVGILQDMQLLQLVGMNYVPNILAHQRVTIKATLSDANTMENITAYFKEPPLFKIPLGATHFTAIFSCMKNIKEASSFVALVNCLVCKLLRKEVEDLAPSLQFLDYIASTFHELVLKFVQESVNVEPVTPKGGHGLTVNVSMDHLDGTGGDGDSSRLPRDIAGGNAVDGERVEPIGTYTCATIDISKKASYMVNVDYIEDVPLVQEELYTGSIITAMFRDALFVSAPILMDALVKFTECNPYVEIYILSYQCALDIAKCVYVGTFFDMYINGYINREALVNYWCSLEDALLFYRKSAPLESSGINFTTLLHSIAIEFITSLVISPFSIAPHFSCQTFVDILDSYVTSKSPILCRISLQRLSDAATCPQVYNGTECKRIGAGSVEADPTLSYRIVYVKHAFFLLLKHLKLLMKGNDVEKLAAMQIAETILTPPTNYLFSKQEMNKHKLLENNKRPILYLLYDDILEGLNGSDKVSQVSKKLLNLLIKSLGVTKFDT